jgi:hypothetical protein
VQYDLDIAADAGRSVALVPAFGSPLKQPPEHMSYAAPWNPQGDAPVPYARVHSSTSMKTA